MNPDKSTLDELRIDRAAPPARGTYSWLVVIVVTLVALAASTLWWLKRPQAIPVRTVTAHEAAAGGQKILLNASGYVTARRAATVSSKVTGKVIQVLIEEGMKVKEGQVLARLDDTNVKASLRLAEAQLESAKNTLAETRVRIKEAEQDLRRA